MTNRLTRLAGRVPALALTLAVGLGLAACATPPEPPPPGLFRDALFAPPAEVPAPAEVFALSESMRDYMRRHVAREARSGGRRDALLQALGSRPGQAPLRLEYDASRTRNASEAFDARSGNCLSLVIMTAALAWELDLDVRFQSMVIDETWHRQGDLLIGAGHVNVTLGAPRSDARMSFEQAALTIDFMPQAVLPGMRVRSIDAATVVAMYMNNRAVEAMADGKLDQAYAFAREAIRQRPDFGIAYNTLGVIYRRHGDPEPAENAFLAALARMKNSPSVLANLASLRRPRPDLPDLLATRSAGGPAADPGTSIAPTGDSHSTGSR